MFHSFGSPLRLSELSAETPETRELRRKIAIAVIDDEPFQKRDSLLANDFRITELGGEIASLDLIATFPIIVCDIKGVGKKFGSRFEGAHVISQIRNYYPDKYLIAFTGMTFDASYNESLTKADKSLTKDSGTDLWISLLDEAIRNVSDPQIRWIRFRQGLLARKVDIYEVFKLEQAYIKAVKSKDYSSLQSAAASEKFLSPEVRDLITKFAISGAGQIISKVLSASA